MARNYNTSVTSSINYLPFNLSASEGLTLNIDNPNQGSSYVVLETRRNSDGFYDENTPKNAQGTYTLTGVTNVVSDDYKAGFVIPPGGGTASFDNTNYVSGSDFRVVGTKYHPFYDALLDRWPNAAAAYSLRRLNSYYDGPAVRVRRSIDDQETDIRFIGTSLDITTLETFCSGGDGFVETWYDQSGNGNHASQTTAASQPQIVSNGSVILENGKPAIQFDGSKFISVWNNVTAPTYFQTLYDPLSIFTIDKPDAISGTSPTGGPWHPIYTIAEIRANTVSILSPFSNGYYDSKYSFGIFPPGVRYLTSTTTTSQQLNSSFRSSNNINVFRNSSSELSTTTSQNPSIGSANSSFTIGVRTRNGGEPDTNFYDGKLQEFILYGSDQSSNRTGIETNINSHYKIY